MLLNYSFSAYCVLMFNSQLHQWLFPSIYQRHPRELSANLFQHNTYLSADFICSILHTSRPTLSYHIRKLKHLPDFSAQTLYSPTTSKPPRARRLLVHYNLPTVITLAKSFPTPESIKFLETVTSDFYQTLRYAYGHQIRLPRTITNLPDLLHLSPSPTTPNNLIPPIT